MVRKFLDGDDPEASEDIVAHNDSGVWEEILCDDESEETRQESYDLISYDETEEFVPTEDEEDEEDEQAIATSKEAEDAANVTTRNPVAETRGRKPAMSWDNIKAPTPRKSEAIAPASIGSSKEGSASKTASTSIVRNIWLPAPGSFDSSYLYRPRPRVETANYWKWVRKNYHLHPGGGSKNGNCDAEAGSSPWLPPSRRNEQQDSYGETGDIPSQHTDEEGTDDISFPSEDSWVPSRSKPKSREQSRGRSSRRVDFSGKVVLAGGGADCQRNRQQLKRPLSDTKQNNDPRSYRLWRRLGIGRR